MTKVSLALELDDDVIADVDRLVDAGAYADRSEVIEAALREAMLEQARADLQSTIAHQINRAGEGRASGSHDDQAALALMSDT